MACLRYARFKRSSLRPYISRRQLSLDYDFRICLLAYNQKIMTEKKDWAVVSDLLLHAFILLRYFRGNLKMQRPCICWFY